MQSESAISCLGRPRLRPSLHSRFARNDAQGGPCEVPWSTPAGGAVRDLVCARIYWAYLTVAAYLKMIQTTPGICCIIQIAISLYLQVCNMLDLETLGWVGLGSPWLAPGLGLAGKFTCLQDRRFCNLASADQARSCFFALLSPRLRTTIGGHHGGHGP